MPTWPSLAVLPAVLLAGTTSALQLPQFELLADLEQAPSTLNPVSSFPNHLASSGTEQLFSLNLPITGRELFLTDGTVAGTRALDALTPTSQGPDPIEAVTLPNGDFLVSAKGDAVGRELFLVDPIQDSITLLADLLPGSEGSNPEQLVTWNGLAWFIADNGVSGRQLWRTDGTAGGTLQVSSILAGVGLGELARLNASAGPLYISSPELDQVYALTAPGGFLNALLPQPPLGDVVTVQLETVGSHLVFGFSQPNTGTELWTTDGTASGTGLLLDLTPGPLGTIATLISNGSQLWILQIPFFFGTQGTELFVSDGTPAGTTSIAFTTETLFAPTGLANTNGLFLSWPSPSGGIEPWFSDGTAAGTQPLGDLVPGTDGSLPKAPVEFGGEIYFSADTASGTGLFRTNGTAAGTFLVEEYLSGSTVESARPLGGSPTHLLVETEGSGSGSEPGSFALGTSSVVSLGNFGPDPLNGSSDPRDWFEVAGRGFFTADVDGLGRELWVTDGTAQGTALVTDLAMGEESSFPEPLTALGERLLLFARDANGVEGLWVTDGSASGTILLNQFVGQGISFSPVGAASLGDQAAVVMSDSTGSESLWLTDGTPAGTFEVAVSATVIGEEPVAFAGEFWFVAQNIAAGRELWRLDGATATAQLGIDLVLGPESGVPTDLIVSGDLLYANARDANGNPSLARIEPSAAFELLGPLGNHAELAQAFGHRGLVFTVRTGSGVSPFTPDELWVTDGSPGNLVLLDGFLLGSVNIQAVEVARDRIFFWASDPVSSVGDSTLWVSSGTPGNEVQIGVGNSQLPSFSKPADSMQSVGSDTRVLLFTENLGSSGSPVIQVADETPGSLELLALLDSAQYGLRLGDTLLLRASDGVLGSEPYAISLSELGGYVAEGYGTGCGAAIAAMGEPRLGSTFEVILEAGPAAVFGLFLSFEQAFNPLGPDCTGLLGNVVAGFGGTTGVNGLATVPLAVPNQPALAGVVTYWQGAVLSSGGPFNGAANLSGGLEIVFGP